VTLSRAIERGKEKDTVSAETRVCISSPQAEGLSECLVRRQSDEGEQQEKQQPIDPKPDPEKSFL